MDLDWHETGTVAETFPPLRLLQDLDLNSQHLEIFAIRHKEELALHRIRRRAAAQTIGDLLDVTWAEVLDWPQVGSGIRDEIVRFLAILSADAPLISAAALGHEERLEQVRDSADRADRAREIQDAVGTLGAWAATVAGGSTLADVLSLASLPRPSDVETAWSILAAFPIPLGGHLPAKDVLTDFLEGLDDRNRLVLLDRVIGPERRTLNEIGCEVGLTRERVRQIESSTRAAIQDAVATLDDWRSVRWAVEALRVRLGAIAPLDARADALPGMPETLQRLVTWLAGYRYEGERLLSAEFRIPRIDELPRMSPKGRAIDEFEVREALLAAGVKHEHVEEIVDSIAGVNRVDGQLVDWTGGQVDRAISVLEVRDDPQDVEELFAFAGGGSLRSFRNRVLESDRIIRVTKNKVGLRSWGGRHYTSVTDLMYQRLSSGPMELRSLADELERMYEISANSVAMYGYAPIFKVTGDMVALRAQNDAFVPREKAQVVEGLFRISADRLLWHIDVDTDLLRGSGRPLPPEIGTFLGLFPGKDGLLLRNPQGGVTANWPETSITGPSIGSLRVHAEALGASEGDVLRLAFTHGLDSLDVYLVPPPRAGELPFETLSRLTGIPVVECHTLGALAAAIGVDEGQVVSTLVKRKDAEVAVAAELVRLSVQGV